MWLVSVITDKPIAEKLYRVRISAKVEPSINWPCIRRNDYLNVGPPFLSNVFQRDADSDTEAL